LSSKENISINFCLAQFLSFGFTPKKSPTIFNQSKTLTLAKFVLKNYKNDHP